MNKLDHVRDVVQRLECSAAGHPGHLPSNNEIRSAAEYLGKYVPSGTKRDLVDAAARGAPLVLGIELTQQFRGMVNALDALAANDAMLRKHLAYMPNHIPEDVRNKNILMSLGLLSYGALGLWLDDVYIPGKRGNGVHFHGEPAWIIVAAMLCAACNLLTVVADHYDQRDNERIYENWAKVWQIVAWVLVIAAVVLDLFVFKKST